MTHSGSGPVIDGLWAFLMASPVADAVGNRIYSFEGPLNVLLPQLIITTVSTTTEYDFGDDVKVYLFQIDLYGIRENITASELLAINDVLVDTLNHTSFPVADHDRGIAVATETGTVTIEDDAIRVFTEWAVESMQLTT